MAHRTQVAEVASWVLFLWLFALMAHDGLSNAHPLWWGVPLVLTLGYLVMFTAYECYTDFKELHQPATGGSTSATRTGSNGWIRSAYACFSGNYSRDEDVEEPGADEASADGENALPPPGDEALISSDDADAEAGRAPEEEQDEEQAASRPAADEQSQFDVMGMMLCNTTAETSESAEGPPEPTPPHLHF